MLRFDQRIRLVIDAGGISEHAEHHGIKSGVETHTREDTKGPWSSVKTIDVVRDHAFFEIDNAGYTILPKSAFETEQKFLEFIEAARRWRGEQINPAR